MIQASSCQTTSALNTVTTSPKQNMKVSRPPYQSTKQMCLHQQTQAPRVKQGQTRNSTQTRLSTARFTIKHIPWRNAVFKMKPLIERKKLLKEHRRCFKCCSPTHMAKECSAELKCNECGSNQHCTPLHPENIPSTLSLSAPPATEPEPDLQNDLPPEITSRCTEICGEGLPARSCVKICLV